jgi:hypothetical protein
MAAAGAGDVLSSIFISIYSWRTFFLIHSSEDYVEMARAKGLSTGLIERRYILRPTLSPIITSFALMLIGLWSGAIILEQVFNWPGLGTLLFRAIGHRDTPVIIGSVVIFAYLLALTVFLLDILYAVLDPRVRIMGRRPMRGAGAQGLRSCAATPRRWSGMAIIALLVGLSVYTVIAIPYSGAGPVARRATQWRMHPVNARRRGSTASPAAASPAPWSFPAPTAVGRGIEPFEGGRQVRIPLAFDYD